MFARPASFLESCDISSCYTLRLLDGPVNKSSARVFYSKTYAAVQCDRQASALKVH
jgi:hypothetical protein